MTTLYSKALIFACAAHAECDQHRKYTDEPYIVHPINVAQILKSYGITDEEMLAAALMHDVLEDTGAPRATMLRKFGERVTGLVDELTEPKHEGNRAERKTLEAARLATISPDAQTIKLADLMDNTVSIVGRDPGFARVYLQEKHAILKTMNRGNVIMWLAAQTQIDRATGAYCEECGARAIGFRITHNDGCSIIPF